MPLKYKHLFSEFLFWDVIWLLVTARWLPRWWDHAQRKAHFLIPDDNRFNRLEKVF